MDSFSLINNNFSQIGGMSVTMMGGGVVLLIAGILGLVFACPKDAKKDGKCTDAGKMVLSYILLKWGGIVFVVIGAFVLWLGVSAK
jgi:hypothetical protein